MLLDDLLGLPHEDWAELNKSERPAARKPRHTRRAKRKH
jgi:hypothetical protein